MHVAVVSLTTWNGMCIVLCTSMVIWNIGQLSERVGELVTRR